MKALQIVNAVVLALCVTLAVTLGVVALIYVVHLESSPRLQAEWPTVARVTAVFWALSLVTGLSFWAQHRRLAWRWPAQASSVVALLLGAFALLRVLRV
jgi:heme/copper-type cytochrome/quinol oxidase subunit 4